MLKNFKPISLILLAGATCSVAVYLQKQCPQARDEHSQQNGKVTVLW